MTDIITFKNITKIYKLAELKALSDINLEIKQGEFFCLVGESGSGKSTLLKLIAGIEKPSSGELKLPEKVGMVFQLGALFPWLTVEENVIFGQKMENASKSKANEMAKTYLKMVNLEGFEKKYPRELSGGQRQRVGIARALAIEPEVLLLDEPFSALDTVTTKELHEELLNIWGETGKTIVMVSHLLEEAVLLADRVGVISDGKLIKTINVDLKRPRNIEEEGFKQKIKEISLDIEK